MASRVTVESVLQKIGERHLECQICKDRFKEPKMLKCSHSFCLECLQTLILRQSQSSQRITCPVCRGKTLLPGKGVADLRTDFKSISLLDDIRQHETELQSLQESQPPSQVSVSKCSKHTDKDLILYCDSCKQLICTSCITKDHKMHPATELNEVLDKCKKKANEILSEVEHHHIIFETVLQDIDMVRKTLDSVFAATKAKISKTADEEIDKEVARIREEEKILIVELEQIHKDRAKTMEIAETTNIKDMNEAQNVKATVNQLMDKENFPENLNLIEKLLQDLEEYTEAQPNIVSVELSYIAFEDNMKSLGKPRLKEEPKIETTASADVITQIWKLWTKLTKKTWSLKAGIIRHMKKDE